MGGIKGVHISTIINRILPQISFYIIQNHEYPLKWMFLDLSEIILLLSNNFRMEYSCFNSETSKSNSIVFDIFFFGTDCFYNRNKKGVNPAHF
jgi:hypothetical protein